MRQIEEKNNNFANYMIYKLFDRFGTPLKKAEVNYLASDIVNQWHLPWHHVHDGLEDVAFMPSIGEWEGFF